MMLRAHRPPNKVKGLIRKLQEIVVEIRDIRHSDDKPLYTSKASRINKELKDLEGKLDAALAIKQRATSEYLDGINKATETQVSSLGSELASFSKLVTPAAPKAKAQGKAKGKGKAKPKGAPSPLKA